MAVTSDEFRDGKWHICVHDLERGVTTKLTNGAHEWHPSWSADGRRIQYDSLQGHVSSICEIAADGSGLPQVLYTIIEPEKLADIGEGSVQQAQCSKATTAIVVEGPGKRGEIVQVCADPECEIHGKPNFRGEQEAAQQQREKAWKRQEGERQKNREQNQRLLNAVLDCIPKKLTRADYETLVFATIDRLQYEDWDAICDRYKIDTDESREPDAAAFELRKKAREATEPQLVRMLMELALLPSGYSEEALEELDPLASTARRYGVSLTAKQKSKTAKCNAKAKRPRTHSKPKSTSKGTRKAAAQTSTAPRPG